MLLLVEKDGGNQKTHVLKYLDTPEEVKKMWALRHDSSNFLIKNPKFVKAVHDHPHVDTETKEHAAKTLARYNINNEATG